MAEKDTLDGFRDVQLGVLSARLDRGEDDEGDYEYGRQVATMFHKLFPDSFGTVRWDAINRVTHELQYAIEHTARSWIGYKGPDQPAKLAGYERQHGKDIPRQVPTTRNE